MLDLTVIIPTIGRETIFDSIKSVDADCEILVMATGSIPEEFFTKLDQLRSKKVFKVYTNAERLTAGVAKRELIKHITTKYFTILDDDDQFVPGYLEVSYKELLRHPECKWLCPHWRSYWDNLDLRNCACEFSLINTPEDVMNNIFEYDEYGSEEERLRKLYVCGALIYDTEAYREVEASGDGYQEGLSLDDMIPAAMMVFNYPGINTHFFCQICGPTPNSVSRRPYKFEEIKYLFDKISIKAYEATTPVMRRLWIRIYSNYLKRLPLFGKDYEG